jgi:hypothetical protein
MPSWWKRSKSAFHRSSVLPASTSTPASPARASTSRAQPGGRRGGGAGEEAEAEAEADLLVAVAPAPKLTRQRKMRHVGGVDVALGDLVVVVVEADRRASSSPPLQRGRGASEAVGIPASTPVSRSSTTREPVAQPPRSASSPVLHPLPLPSPRPADLEAQDPPAGVADAWTAPRCVSVPFSSESPFPPLLLFFLPNFISSELIDCCFSEIVIYYG